MADIDVTFGTNAATVAGQVDQAAASTSRAAGAAKAHAVASAEQAKALGVAIQAAKLHGTATKEEITAMRIAQLEMRKKAAEAGKLAMAESTAAAATTASAKAAKAQAASLAASQAAALRVEQKQNQAGRQTALRGAGFLGGGKAALGAQALVGKDAGMGSLVMAMGVMGGVGIAIGLLTDAIMKWWVKTDEMRMATDNLADKYDDIKKANIERGIGAASQLGGGLIRATALGQRGRAGELMKDFRGGDALGAANTANTMFPNREDQALKIAATVAKTIGADLMEVLPKMEGMRLNDGTAAAVASKILEKNISSGGFSDMQARVGGSQEAANIGILGREAAAADVFGVEMIAKAADDAMARTTQLRNAEAEALRAMAASYNEWQKELDKRAAAAKTAERYARGNVFEIANDAISGALR